MKEKNWLKLALIKKDYEGICSKMTSHHRFIYSKHFIDSNISKKQIVALAEYAISKQDVEFLSIIFDNLSEEYKFKVGNLFAGDLYNKVLSKYNENFFAHKLKFCIDALINNQRDDLLLKIIGKFNYINENFANKLKDYFISKTDLEHLVLIARYYHYVVPQDLMDKILEYDFNEYFPLLIKYHAISNTFLKSSISKIKPENIKEFIVHFYRIPQLLNDLYKYVINNYKGKEQNSYLFELIGFCPNAYFGKSEIANIILENIVKNNEEDDDLENMDKVMSYLTEEEQNEKCLKALEENDEDLIIVLAITTDCITTYKLVDYILRFKSILAYGFLLQNLKGRFSNYAMDRIIKENDIDITRQLLNQLYLFDAIGFIIFIRFIVEYKYITLFSEQEQIFIMENYAEKEDLILNLKK